MAPKTPKNQTTKPKDKDDNVVATGNDASMLRASGTNDTVNCSEAQEEEIEVLKAIYMDDFEDVEVKSAWSKTLDRAFKLKIKSFSNDDTWVQLLVKFTATYPKTPPVLNLNETTSLHTRTQTRIARILGKRPAEMLGEVMMHTIASEIQDALEDAVQAREQGALPSLEDERAIHEAAVSVQVREEQEAEAKRDQEAKAEEDRALQQMIREEVERREAKKPTRSAPSGAAVGGPSQVPQDDIVTFDQTLEIPVAAGIVTVDAVQLVTRIESHPNVELFAAKPLSVKDTILAVRCSVLSVVNHDDRSNKHDLLALEEELEVLKSIRQANLSNIYAFKLDKDLSDDPNMSLTWHITVLSDLANRGTLAEWLEDGQTVPLEKARQWSLDLLEALDFLHRHGIIHKAIHTRNVLLSRTSAGVTIPLLSDAAYEYRLRQLQTSSAASKRSYSTNWTAPECLGDHPSFTRKSDIWEFGIVFLQMLLGSAMPMTYTSPSVLMDSLHLSDALGDLVHRLFLPDHRQRPTAFDVLPSEFLRSNASIMNVDKAVDRRRPSSSLAVSGLKSPLSRRSRHNSGGVTDSTPLSRYANDFTELHRLGRGGFGEVVKARNKVDGGIYAIKKIKQDTRSQLEQVLSEVMLLHRLNHAYVVRYYTAWVEDDLSGSVELDESAVSTSEDFTSTSDNIQSIEFGLSSRGLDFVSSSGYNNIQFGNDDSSEEESDSDEETTDDADPAKDLIEESIDSMQQPLKRGRGFSQRMMRSTLYIQMEFCERRTLRDLIVRGMHEKPEEGWQMLRQILEGLAHIHGHGIIHRDLKPDNVFIDIAGNPRIGDFGLATTSRTQSAGRITASHNTAGDMTRSVGTALYVAPELQSASTTSYNDKVDMYSLGIIFFEMCYPLSTAMERLKVLQELRQRKHELPPTFESTEKLLQGSVIQSLISHVPSERPSSVELLRSGTLPIQIEDETVRRALQSLSDPGSPYYQKMMSALFSQTPDQRVKDYAWDARIETANTPSLEEARMRTVARSIATSIFRRHGAEETQRPTLLPRSNLYSNPNVVQLLDSTGILLQLPYDLTLPYARLLAKDQPSVQRTFCFGHVYRDVGDGGQPRTYGEVDFDITASDGEDLALHDAEAMKIVEEIIDDTPALATASMSFHINHSDILDIVLESCRIDSSQRLAVKESLSKLNFHQWNWTKIRAELRSPLLAIPSTSLDDLAQFDFRDAPEKAITKLETLLEDSVYANRLRRPIKYLREVVDILHSLGVHRNTYLCPLACHNEKFYNGGIIFQCIFDKKNRSVFAAGGRYDSLIESHRTRSQTSLPLCHAVGVNIGWDGLIAAMLRHQKGKPSPAYAKHGTEDMRFAGWKAKRCDVLIASLDPAVLRSAGVRLLTTLWTHDISAELATDSRSIDDLLGRDKAHSWIVIIKHEAAPTLKVRNTGNDTENDIAATGLVAHIRHEMRERDHHLLKSTRPPPALMRGSSHSDQERKGNVQVLLSQHRSKKSNKFHIVDAAQQRWRDVVDEFKDAPILAIETSDSVLERLRETRLGDLESWKKVVQSVQLNERNYLMQVQDLLSNMRKKWEGGDAQREACVFNFRTGACIYYDLGL